MVGSFRPRPAVQAWQQPQVSELLVLPSIWLAHVASPATKPVMSGNDQTEHSER